MNRIALGYLAALALLSPALALAQPQPRVDAVYPKGGQRGASVDVTFYGDQLAEATGLVFSGDGGLTGEVPPRGKPAVELVFSRGGAVRAQEGQTELRARITIDPAAALGIREARVVSPRGVSAPVAFAVGDLPEIFSAEPNNTIEQAQPIALPATINGAIRAPAETDKFRFAAKKGQRLIFDCRAYRDGSPLDGTLTLYDAQGRQLAQDEDTNGLDPLIDFSAPADGDYIIELRDLRFEGSLGHTYRLSCGEIPYLDMTFPLGARRGQEADLELIGRNLDGASKLRLKIEPGAPIGAQEIRASTPKGLSNSRAFDIGDAAETMEAEPNDAPDKATPISIPATINGRIGAAKDQDFFKFKLDAPQAIVFDALSARFGSPADLLMTVQTAAGAIVGQANDVDKGDPRFRLDLGPGDYVISLRDLLDRGGPSFVYRLYARPPQPRYRAKFFPDAIRVYRGGGAILRVEVEREAGFGGAVEAAFKGLPAGVTGERLLLKPGEAEGGLLALSAAEDAPLGTFPITLAATADLGGEKVERAGLPIRPEREAPGQPRRDLDSREAFLTVMDDAPFTIEPATLSAEIAQEQGALVEVVARRRKGFKGDIQVTAEGFSSGRRPISDSVAVGPATLAGGQTRGAVGLTALAQAEIGTRRIALLGTATVDGQPVTVASSTLPLTIFEIPFMLSNQLSRLSLVALPPGTQSAAGEAEISIKAARRGWFTDEIALSVEGLPEGVNAALVNMGKGIGEATIKLTATDKAPTDKPITLKVVGSANVNGRDYRQATPPISLTIAKPPEPAKPADAPKPAESAKAGS